MDGPCEQLRKGDSIVVYVQALAKVTMALQSSDHDAAQAECEFATGVLDEAAEETSDPDLQEISGLLHTYCGNAVGEY
ncbi:MAG: hypothetical protein R6V85_14335 [Polyangia bacterium]